MDHEVSLTIKDESVILVEHNAENQCGVYANYLADCPQQIFVSWKAVLLNLISTNLGIPTSLSWTFTNGAFINISYVHLFCCCNVSLLRKTTSALYYFL